MLWILGFVISFCGLFKLLENILDENVEFREHDDNRHFVQNVNISGGSNSCCAPCFKLEKNSLSACCIGLEFISTQYL